VPELPLEHKIKYYNKCNLDVARLCNHQKAAAKNFDEQVGKMEARIKEIEEKIASLKKLLPKLKKGQTSDDAKMPKSTEACKSEIERQEKRLE
jgi:DNA topoisomerase-1